MRKRIFCLLLAAGVMSSSIIVNAGSLPEENVTVQETFIEEEAEAETEQPAEEQEEDSQEESGDDIQETPWEEELLGGQTPIKGGSDQGSAVGITLGTEYVSQEKGCWYKFTTKNEPAYYELKVWKDKSGGEQSHFYIKDDMKDIMDVGLYNEHSDTIKLKQNYTYYIKVSESGSDFKYIFSVTAYDDPEGDSLEEAFSLPINKIRKTSCAVEKDVDYYRIQTGQAGYYRFEVINESVNEHIGFTVKNEYGFDLGGRDVITGSGSKNLCFELEGNTKYYICVYSMFNGGRGNYSVQCTGLTDKEGNTKETAYNLREGDVYEGDLCAGIDEDFYRLIPGNSGKYTIEISNTSKSGSNKDYKIYTERNEVLKSGWVYSERKESVELELTAGHTYYLYIYGNKNDNNMGKYLVSYSREFPFSDVAVQPGWRYDSIKYVLDNNIMNGISGTTRFDPDEPLTRAMFATVLYRMAGNPAVTFENHFSDVKSGIYYSNAVIWAWKKGIVNGYQDGRFGVNDNITREQIAKMLNKYAEVRKYDISERADINSFPDVSDVSGWAVGFIQWAVGSGMVTGKNVGGTYYLDPKGNATRVECAAMLTRFMKRYAS